MRMLTRYGTQPIGRVLPMMLALSLLTGCAGLASSATSDTICRELARDLPTYSRNDTPETLASGARFVGIFKAVCP